MLQGKVIFYLFENNLTVSLTKDFNGAENTQY